MSGFLEQDVPAIVACAGELGLRPVATAARDGWMMVHMRKG
jgi:ribosomal protein L11 methyltransferase